MRWYDGGIADAVTLSRSNNSIFVVYVEGKDDKSTELTKVIDSQEVSSQLESESFVAIKVEANSVPHQQFSEIYNQVNVPSVYFIGKSGAPLEIIEEATDSNEFVQKIDNILKKNGSPTGSTSTIKAKVTSDFILRETKPAEEVVAESSTNKPEESVAAEVSTSSGEPSVVDNKVEQTELKSNTETASPAEVNSGDEPESSPEEKVERAKALIEKKRLEKEQEEKEKEKNKEVERRKAGQDVQKLKRWQQDQELKNIIEEREREKKEQLAARQRILAQIEQDKADRAARFSNSPQPVHQSLESQPAPRTPTNNSVARLQFKLPDGSSHTHEFSNHSLLLEVRNYVKSNLNLPFNNFVLATTFPRREFTNVDDSQTLQDLELVPTAVILVLPVVHAPILGIFGYLRNMIFGGPKPPPSTGVSSSQENKRSIDTSTESSRSLPKRRMGETSVIRRQGNVHRLTDKSDSDDENNTWNGNSTQQM